MTTTEREARRLAAIPEAEKLKAWLNELAATNNEGPDIDDVVCYRLAYAECMRNVKAEIDGLFAEIDSREAEATEVPTDGQTD